MHITVVPASPKTAHAAIKNLLDDHRAPTVRAIYRDPSKAPDYFVSNPRFTAVKGDVEDVESLDVSGSDAVLAITPPKLDGSDIVAFSSSVSENLKGAISRAGSVKRLVLLSSMGAQYEDVGEINSNHAAEKVFKGAAPEVVFVRPGYFMENWASGLETLLTPEPFFHTTVTPVDFKMPMVAVEDIGRTLAAELVSTGESLPSNPYVFNLRGPQEYSSEDVQKAFEEALGKKVGMTPIDVEGLEAFFGYIFDPVTAKDFADMNRSFLPGGIIERDPNPSGAEKKGQIGLVEVFKGLLA